MEIVLLLWVLMFRLADAKVNLQEGVSTPQSSIHSLSLKELVEDYGFLALGLAMGLIGTQLFAKKAEEPKQNRSLSKKQVLLSANRLNEETQEPPKMEQAKSEVELEESESSVSRPSQATTNDSEDGLSGLLTRLSHQPIHFSSISRKYSADSSTSARKHSVAQRPSALFETGKLRKSFTLVRSFKWDSVSSLHLVTHLLDQKIYVVKQTPFEDIQELEKAVREASHSVAFNHGSSGRYVTCWIEQEGDSLPMRLFIQMECA